MNRIIAIAAVAACKQSVAPSCSVELSGNYIETSHSTKSCPTLGSGAGATRGDTLLRLDIASSTLGGSFAIVIDLGPTPTRGAYNSGTTELWSAAGIAHHAATGACVFQAGNNATPTGDFSLDLTAIDRTLAHGTLAIRMFVLPRVSNDGTQTDCGSGTTEQLRVRF
jgi:hypothetical protein